jgi:signal transduction histidine kinase/ActR/RegA family two-component response regulator
MFRPFHYLDNIVTKMAQRDNDPINQTRIRMLSFFMLAYIIFALALIVVFNPILLDIQMIRAAVVLTLAISLFLIIRYSNNWKFASHFVIITLTLGAWSNLLIYEQGVHVSTIQYVWLASALSFYVLGSKWGWFYSTLNVIPIILFLAFNLSGIITQLPGPFPINRPVYVFAVTYNFMVIIFLHYYFFKRFYENFTKLTKTNQQIDELNNKLEATLVDVRKLSNSRMDFLSTMSHELRTPLNGVIGISNALLAEDPRIDQKENLDILKFSAENLLSLINDILDFNKLDSGKMVLENKPFDLDALLHNCFNSLNKFGKEKYLEQHLFIDDSIKGKLFLGDPTRLTQILLNLINNALKFTEKGSITLLADVTKCDDKKINIHFVVEDTGIGIQSDQQESIFDVFFQASANTNRNYTGTGLGLPIIKKILHLLGSEIYLESQQKKGSKFYFDIEFEYKIADSILPKPKIANENIKLLKVLVVEDNNINRIVIRKTLERWSITPVTVESGYEAIEKLQEEDFDLILMDLYMPKMNGYETTALIRNMKNPSKSQIPIIALTAAIVDNEIMEKIHQSGMNDYLSKPFDPDYLSEKLEKILEAKKPQPNI